MHRTFAALVAITSLAAFAQEEAAPAADAAPSVEAPSADAVKSVWQYYFKGKGGGPVLVDAIPCLEVAKDGDNKNECVKPVPEEGVKAGTLIYVWQSYLMPKDEAPTDLQLQVKLGDTVRETKDIQVKGELRTRNWTAVKIAKAGTWNLVLRKGDQDLKSVTVKAN